MSKRLFVTGFFVHILLAAATASADDPYSKEYQKIFFARSVPNASAFHSRLERESKPWPDLTVRSLIDHSYVLVSADKFFAENPPPASYPSGLLPQVGKTIRLLELVDEMQDKKPDSLGYGNFRWYWRTPEVTDRNAVEFVSAHAIPIWIDARDRLPEQSQKLLKGILERCVDGCLKHRVRPDYTNIALSNAVHLIVLGETFDRPDAVRLGEERLRIIAVTIWNHGIYEYNSPTYAAVDCDALQLGLRCAKKEETRELCKTLLDYLWCDLALNWYGPAQRLCGSQSRTYNYLQGIADVNRLFEFAELSPVQTSSSGISRLDSFFGPYRPTAETLALSGRFPRTVRERWGGSPGEWRASFITKEIALGTASATYPNAKQDVVLSVDLADYDTIPPATFRRSVQPRCYFIPDGRNDPYGDVRLPTSTAGHEKSLHLCPFWTAAQRNGDVLGIVLYPEYCIGDTETKDVLSHFVLRTPQEIWIGKQRLAEDALEVASSHEVGRDSPVFLRYGSKGIGIRILWSRTENGKSASAQLVNDGNKKGVLRLTIHHWDDKVSNPLPITGDKKLVTIPGAVLWVRVGSGWNTDEEYEKWCEEFEAASPKIAKIDRNDFEFEVPGLDGPVRIVGSKVNFSEVPTKPAETGRVGDDATHFAYLPEPPRGIIELDGKELGRPILETHSLLSNYSKRIAEEITISVNPVGDTAWESESGIVPHESLIEALPEANASNGKAVRINGPVHWTLKTTAKGPYYLWAKVLTTDSQHDSVNLRISGLEDSREQSANSIDSEWHLGSAQVWRWVPFKFDLKQPQAALRLRDGEMRLSLEPREYDVLIDAFLLTTEKDKDFRKKR